MQLQNIQGPFAQIKTHDEHREFQLMDIWTVVVPAKSAQPTVNSLKKLFPDDKSLVHIRRINKLKQEDGVMYMRVAICPVSEENHYHDHDRDQVEKLLKSVDIAITTLERKQCCKYQGLTKQQTAEWAERAGWPMVWRGNVDMIPTPLSEIERRTAADYLKQLDNLLKQEEDNQQIACLIVDPTTNKVIIKQVDTLNRNRDREGILDHCVMKAVYEAASKEQERRESGLISNEERTYLCLNMHVYITHEPCVMCAMALNHSRISKLFYIKSVPETGGIEPTSGGGHSVHWNKNLNWQYEAWRYIEADIKVEGYNGHV